MDACHSHSVMDAGQPYSVTLHQIERETGQLQRQGCRGADLDCPLLVGNGIDKPRKLGEGSEGVVEPRISAEVRGHPQGPELNHHRDDERHDDHCAEQHRSPQQINGKQHPAHNQGEPPHSM